MPGGGNFHPDWGVLAPAPSFMRTARIVAVATAIGATAGAGVVLSLAGPDGAVGPLTSSGPAYDKPLVIVHSLVQPAEAAPVAVQSAPSPVNAAAPQNLPTAASVPADTAVPSAVTPAPASSPVVAAAPIRSDSHSASTPAVPASVAALAEIPPATEGSPTPAADQATFTPDQTGAQKVDSKKPRNTDQAHTQTAAQNAPRRRSEERGFGSLLRHFFSARAGSGYN